MPSVRLEKLAKSYCGGVGAVNDLINPATINDRKTYPEPTREPAGIDKVLVNGQPVVEHRFFDGGKLAGEVIQKGGGNA